MLIKGIKMHFPQLKIIGQQTKQFEGKIDFDYQSIVPQYLPSNVEIHSKSLVQQCCLWIDPIDCTKGFIEGALEDVTVLIGMSALGYPTIGLIAIPFKIKENEKVFQPEILLGSVQDKKAYKFNGQSTWKQLKKRKPMQELTVTTSVSRSNSVQEKYINHMKAKNILAGGSGRKIALVIKGEADMMAYVGSATCKWDSCAGEAIVKSMNGQFTTPTGKAITYFPDESISNQDGIFCSLNSEVHAKSIDFMKSLKTDELY